MLNLQLLLPLIAGHLIGDFVLQTSQMVADKGRVRTRMIHATIVALVSWILAGYWATWWWLIPGLLIPHFLIDSLKNAVEKKLSAESQEDGSWMARNAEAALFTADQTLHMAVLLGLAYASSLPGLAKTVVGESWWVSRFGGTYLSLLILVAGFILAVYVTGFVLGFLLRRFAMQEEGGLPGGGLYIGFFERAIIFIFVMAGQPAGIGFLVAAKSVFRFGELKDKKDRAIAEYILIGTLMSFTFAMIVAYATRYLLRGAF